MNIKPPSANTQLPPSLGINRATDSAKPETQGRVLIATVLSRSENQAASTPTKTIFDVVLNTNGQKIETQGNHAFQVGQQLKIEIINKDNIRVLQVINNLALDSGNVIQQGLRQSLPLQQPQNLLLNNLQALLSALNQQQGTAAEKVLFQNAQTQASKLLSLQPRLEQLGNPVILKQAINNNGVFLENKLQQVVLNLAKILQTANSPKGPGQTISEALQNNVPLAKQTENLLAKDSKAQTLKLVQALAPLLSQQAPPATATKAAETQIISQIIQTLATTRNAGSNQQLPLPFLPNIPITTQLQHLLKPQNSAKNQSSISTGKDSFDLAVSTLLRQLAASLSRIQTTQLSSLSGLQTSADAPTATHWQMEIPVYVNGSFRPIQLHVEEDAHSETKENNPEGRQWKITLGFDFEALGEFYATLVVIENSISTTFWSERPNTLERIQKDLEELKTSLLKLGLQVNQLDCRKGTPLLKQTRLDQQLVDIKT